MKHVTFRSDPHPSFRPPRPLKLAKKKEKEEDWNITLIFFARPLLLFWEDCKLFSDNVWYDLSFYFYFCLYLSIFIVLLIFLVESENLLSRLFNIWYSGAASVSCEPYPA